MGAADFYKPGDFNRLCERSGMKVKASNTQKEWNNRIVRTESWEPRQPQDLIRSRPDNQQVADPRVEAADVFAATNEVKAEDL